MAMKAGRAGMALAALLAMAAGAEAGGQVAVVYEHPEKFTDVGRSYFATAQDRAINLTWIREHLERWGAANLPAGQTLTLTITDIDLAGEFEHWRGPRFDRVRTYRDVFPPRFALRFALADATGAVLREGQRDLTNTDYLVRSTLRSEDPLRYDKTLLDQWLAREFPRPSS
jgi:hypothetical protein